MSRVQASKLGCQTVFHNSTKILPIAMEKRKRQNLITSKYKWEIR